MYGALPSGPSVMAREVPALSATTAATSTNATRSCLPGPNTYSTTSGHATRFRYTVHSGSTLFGHDPVLSVSYAVGSSFTFFSRTVGTFYRRHTESCTVLVALVSDGVFFGGPFASGTWEMLNSMTYVMGSFPANSHATEIISMNVACLQYALLCFLHPRTVPRTSLLLSCCVRGSRGTPSD
jgi:hypothetical protein